MLSIEVAPVLLSTSGPLLLTSCSVCSKREIKQISPNNIFPTWPLEFCFYFVYTSSSFAKIGIIKICILGHVKVWYVVMGVTARGARNPMSEDTIDDLNTCTRIDSSHATKHYEYLYIRYKNHTNPTVRPITRLYDTISFRSIFKRNRFRRTATRERVQSTL